MCMARGGLMRNSQSKEYNHTGDGGLYGGGGGAQ